MRYTKQYIESSSEQEIFDKMVLHLRTQNCKSMHDIHAKFLNMVEKCAYRGKNDTKCAVGCILDDRDYNVRMEGKSWQGLVEPSKGSKSIKTEIIIKMQKIHDAYNVKDWEIEFQKAACYFGLNLTPLDKPKTV